MHIRLLLLVPCLWTLGCASAAKPHCAWPDGQTRSSVVQVSTPDGDTASGVVVGKDRVLTVAHVFDDEGTAMVEIAGSAQVAVVLGINPTDDLALLAVPTRELAPLPVSSVGLRRAEPVWAIGFPLAAAQDTTPGYFQRHHRGKLYTSAPIDSGESGGGLVRCAQGEYELAGIVWGFVAYRRGESVVNLRDQSLAVPSNRIIEFIEAVQGPI